MTSTRTVGRLVSVLPVAAFHLAALLVLSQTFDAFHRPDADAGVMQVFFLQPTRQTERDGAEDAALSQLAVMTDHPLDLTDISQIPLDIAESRNAGTTISAPTLRGGNAIDMAAYIAQAGLLPGEGATVILRVEVMPTGEPGRMSVDVSSGSNQVDQAAMAYARQMRWFAGRTNETPEAMWIRWSVRLQA